MPKVKINKMVEGSKTFYHTHPSKDEPSLSSADDYQWYADAAFAFGATNFYTIMENRIDHFVFSVNKSKEEDYLKMDEDKFLNDIATGKAMAAGLNPDLGQEAAAKARYIR